MAEVGTYYITIMPEMSKFTGSVNKAMGDLGGTSGKTFNGSFLDVVKGSAIGTALGGVASKLGSTFMSGISTGISRLDTLNNFPRVMESFGYSADEASDAVNNIMEHLRGLPTASQDVVSLTQAISDSTGDLDLASRAALGFNDMMLAAGASTSEMTTASGILNRILGKGSATTAQWQSLMAVMPKQLDMVAESMLGTGASSMDLYEALENGTVSYNDMLAAIAKLDEDGGGRMASFYDQAKANSIGIGSAIANVQNRIGAGWANVLNAIGQQEIHDALEGVADALKAPLDALANGLAYIKDKVGNTAIFENIKKVMTDIGDAIGGLWKDGGPDMLKSLADSLVSLTDGALQWLADNGDLVKTAIGGIAGALAAIMGFKIGTELAKLPATFTALTAALSANPFILIVGGISALVMALYTFFTQTETGKQLWSDFCTIMSDLWAGLQQDWSNLCAVLSQEWESFKAFIDGIPAWWQGIMDYWSNAMSEQANNFKVSWDKIKGDFSAAWDAIKAGASEKWNNIKTTMGTAVESIRSNVSQKWEAMKNNVSSLSDSIKSTVSDKFNAAKNAALNVFENLKSGIVDKLRWAKDTMAGIVDSIKGLFNFSWSLPRPSLPHINWHWDTVGGLLSIPVFDGISWYAKGGVFDTATLIGIGERGKEAALPLNRQTYGEIARGIQGEMGATPSVTVTGNTFYVREEADIDRIADALSRKIRRERMAMA